MIYVAIAAGTFGWLVVGMIVGFIVWHVDGDGERHIGVGFDDDEEAPLRSGAARR